MGEPRGAKQHARGGRAGAGRRGGRGSAGISFEEVLRTVPESSAAGALEDLSVHLCFICALHLANEHGLSISSGEGLDTLSISLPTPSSS